MTDGSLYLMRLGVSDLYKIGVSGKPCRRRDCISSGEFWGQVQIVGVWPGAASLERRLHRRFGDRRESPSGKPTSGRTEWFRLTRDDVQQIKAECRLWMMRQEEKKLCHK